MPTPPETLRIATRASELALWQAHHVADLIRAAYPEITVSLVDVTTQGDVDQTQPLWQLGGTGVFTKEVQRVVLEGKADLAVHSLKDLPTEVLEPELCLGAVPARECRWDALILPRGSSLVAEADDPLKCLPEGSRIGTGSLRRQAQLRSVRPDLQLREIRGNLNTRLGKLDAGEYDALILAAAGVLRLGWKSRLSCLLVPPVMLPAVGQGALGLECRTADTSTRLVLDGLNDPQARLCTQAERALLGALRAGCHAPVGVDCDITDNQLRLTGLVLSPDGTQRVQASREVTLSAAPANWSALLAEADRLGTQTADALIAQGARELIDR